MNDAEEQATLELMDRYGGSFVKQLATLYRCADPQNRAILRTSFARYFGKYAEMAKQEPR